MRKGIDQDCSRAHEPYLVGAAVLGQGVDCKYVFGCCREFPTLANFLTHNGAATTYNLGTLGAFLGFPHPTANPMTVNVAQKNLDSEYYLVNNGCTILLNVQ